MKKIIISIIVLSTMSCATQLTQRQIEINYKLDKLYLDYRYKSDSLINEFYKK